MNDNAFVLNTASGMKRFDLDQDEKKRSERWLNIAKLNDYKSTVMLDENI